jgi:hypothetical protein
MIVYVDGQGSEQRLITSAVLVEVNGVVVAIQATKAGLDIIQREGEWHLVPGERGVMRLLPVREPAA